MAADFLDAAYQDVLDEDGLLIIARGLGKQRLIAKFLRMEAELETSSPSLILCLNMASTADNQLLANALLAEGMSPDQLPRIITNDTVSSQREALYRQGGVFLVTSRILIVDMLSSKLDVSKVRGFVVNHAHRVTDTSTEAFIIRIYRQKNRTGFLKAFSDEPEQLLQGFAKLERVLKYCYLRRVYLWPRYHVAVKEFLARHEPEVVEMAQALTPAMKAIQHAILVAMDGCLKELKRVTTVDASTLELTLTNGIFKAFDTLLRRQLDPEWHRISPKTKQLVQDLTLLRRLLDYLLRYDAVTFYSFLISVQRSNAQHKYPSDWLSSIAADRLYHHAKSRVYRLRERAAGGKGKGAGGSSSGSTSTSTSTSASKKDKELTLEVVLEENPKWKLLGDVLAEIERTHQQQQQQQQQQTSGTDNTTSTAATSSSSSTTKEGEGGAGAAASASALSSSGEETETESEGEGENHKKERIKEKKDTTNKEASTDTPDRPRILILVRDGRTCAQLWTYLRRGGPYLLRRRFQHLLSQVQPVQPLFPSTSPNEEEQQHGDGNGKKKKGALTGKAAIAAKEKKLLVEEFARMEREEEEGQGQGGKGKGKVKRKMVVIEVDEGSDKEEREEEEEEEESVEGKRGKGGGKGGEEEEDPEATASEEEEEQDSDDSGSEAVAAAARGKRKTRGKAKTDKSKGKATGAAAAAGKGTKRGAGRGRGRGKGSRGGGRGQSKRGGKTPRTVTGRGGGGGGGRGRKKRKGNDGEETAQTTLAMAEDLFQRNDLPWNIDNDEDDTRFAHVLMYTYSQAYQNMSLLDEVEPSYIILYDPDTQFVREVEVYQARRGKGPGQTLQVYFIVYEESVEEQRYLTALNREKEAFERLVHEKKHMILPSEVYEAVLPTPGSYIDTLVADTRARRGLALPRTECTKVVVDVREFRSSLPNLLHEGGLQVIPATLEIGDFVLTPEIVVERKSVQDLFQSFASGRLFSQVESMLRYYKVATLLIEFQDDKAFSLQSAGEISTDIQVNNICSKLVLLTLHFPQMRILWSRNSHFTVKLFKALKANNAEVDVQKALTAGGGGGGHGEDEGGGGGGGGGGAAGEEGEARKHLTAQDLLLKLPGVNMVNYRAIMRKCDSLSQLSRLSVEELNGVMESEACAQKLWDFLNQRIGDGGGGKKGK